jgi:hypothetical protein
MKWKYKLCALGLLYSLPNCGDTHRENSTSRFEAAVESFKRAPRISDSPVNPKLSEAEISTAGELRNQQEAIAEVAFDKIDAMSTSAPEYAESLVSFWNEYQATASPSTRRNAIFTFNRLLELQPRYQTPEALAKLGYPSNRMFINILTYQGAFT